MPIRSHCSECRKPSPLSCLIVAVDDREFAGLPVVGQDVTVFTKILERKAVHFTSFAIDGNLLLGAAVDKYVVAMPAVVGLKVEVSLL